MGVITDEGTGQERPRGPGAAGDLRGHTPARWALSKAFKTASQRLHVTSGPDRGKGRASCLLRSSSVYMFMTVCAAFARHPAPDISAQVIPMLPGE